VETVCSTEVSAAYLVLPRLDKKADDGFFAERLCNLQAVQALDKHETRAVGPYQDRRLQALVENARGDLVYALLFGGSAPFHWHVDVGDCQSRALHHGGAVARPFQQYVRRISQDE
jgi:hypothetical protein